MADETVVFVQSSDPATGGPQTLATLSELRRTNKLPGSTPVSRDEKTWESLDVLLDREAPEESVFVECPDCNHTGKITALPPVQTTFLFLIGLVLLVLLASIGIGATNLILWKLKLGGAEWGAWVFATSSGAFAFIRQFAESEFRLTRKFQAWWNKVCPYCEAGLRKRREIGIPSMMTYLLDLFLFQEVLVPTYKTLTYQWLWRDARPKDETGLWRAWKTVAFTLVIFGPIPFLAFLAGSNSPVTLGASALVAFAVWRLTFQKVTTPYMKGITFLMVPLYYVSMVEIIRWCWVLSLPPEGAPPDTSDLYLLGVDTLLSTQLFMGLPNKAGIKLFSGSVDSALTGWALFYLRLLLDISLIAALSKALLNAIWSAQVFRQTGLRGGIGKADAKAIPAIQEVTLKRDPTEISKLEKSLRDVVGALTKARPYVRGVAVAAEPGSEPRAAADRSLALLEGADVKAFLASGKSEKKDGASAGDGKPTVGERVLSVLVVAAWAGLIALFFQGAILRALKRDVGDLVERAGKPALAENPLARRELYERALRKTRDMEPRLRTDRPFAHLLDQLLLRAANNDLDVAQRRLFLLDLDQTLIEIDTAFQKTIHLDELMKGEQTRDAEARHATDFIYENPYLKEVKEVSARAYGQRGRVFYLRNDRDRAVAELRKERTLETRRLLFLIALDRAAEDLLAPTATSELSNAVAELGIDEAYPPGRLVAVGRAMILLREGKLEEGLQRLRPLEASLGEFSRKLRGDIRYVTAEALLRLDQDERPQAIQTLRDILKEWTDHGEARLALGHALRLAKDSRASKVEFEAAATLRDEATNGHARLALALLALERKDVLEAQRLLVGLARERDTDPLFHEDLAAFLAGNLGATEFRERADRWREEQHYAQMILAGVAIGLDALAKRQLGTAALEFRQVVIEGDPGHAEVDLSRALLDLIQVEKEKRSFNPELFFHQLHLNRIGSRIRDEIKLILLPPEEITRVLAFALEDKRPEERSRAITAVALSRLLEAKILKPYLEKGLADKDASVRLAALEALGALGSEAATASLPKVMGVIADKDERVRRAAVRVIQVAGGEESEKALEKALEDKDRYVRRDAAYALARIGPIASRALTVLVNRMDDPEIMVRDAALAGVRALDQAGAEALVAAIGTVKDSAIAIESVKHLEAAHPQVYVRERERITTFALRVLEKDPDPASRRWAAVRLAGLPRDARVAVAPVLSAVVAGLNAAYIATIDTSVRMGTAKATLKAVRTYGVDPGLATRFYVEAVRAHPDLRQAILTTTLDPAVGEAAVYVVEALAREKDQKSRAVWLNTSVCEQRENTAAIASLTVARLLPLAIGEDKVLAETASKLLNDMRALLPNAITAPVLLAHVGDANPRVRGMVLDVVNYKGFTLEPELRSRLVAGLQADDAGVRKTHFSVLADLAFEDASLYDVIAKAALTDKDPQIQASALSAAVRHPELLERITPELVKENLPARKDDVGKSALVILLAAEGPEKAFAALGASPDVAARTRFIGALAKWSKNPALRADPPLLGTALALLVEDPDPAVALAAVRELFTPEPKKDLAPALPALRRIAEGKDAKLVPLARAALLLGSPGTADAKLVQAVFSSKETAGFGKRSVEALAASQAVDRASSIACALSSTQADVRAAASRALGALGAEAHEPLGRALEGASPEACLAALDAVAAQGSAGQPLAPRVVKLLGGTATPRIEAAAVKALGCVGLPGARDPIRDIMSRKQDPELEAECWIALGRLGVPESSREIVRLLDAGAAPSAGYTAYLARSLVEVDRDAGLRYLLGALRERYGRLDVAAAAGLLGSLGPVARPALRELQALALDANPTVRIAASDAVQKIQ